MKSAEIAVETGDQLVTDVTDHLKTFCQDCGDGLINVFVPHATAGIAIMETRSGSETDLARTVNELLPKERRYAHQHGSPGHGRDHVLPCFISPSATIPVEAGRPLLGAWQRLVIVDSNGDNPRRKLRLSFLRG